MSWWKVDIAGGTKSTGVQAVCPGAPLELVAPGQQHVAVVPGQVDGQVRLGRRRGVRRRGQTGRGRRRREESRRREQDGAGLPGGRVPADGGDHALIVQQAAVAGDGPSGSRGRGIQQAVKGVIAQAVEVDAGALFAPADVAQVVDVVRHRVPAGAGNEFPTRSGHVAEDRDDVERNGTETGGADDLAGVVDGHAADRVVARRSVQAHIGHRPGGQVEGLGSGEDHAGVVDVVRGGEPPVPGVEIHQPVGIGVEPAEAVRGAENPGPSAHDLAEVVDARGVGGEFPGQQRKHLDGIPRTGGGPADRAPPAGHGGNADDHPGR